MARKRKHTTHPVENCGAQQPFKDGSVRQVPLVPAITDRSSATLASVARDLVWTQERKVFCVADSWSFMSFDSSNRYGMLREGRQVRAQVAGWRVRFLSWYRNILIVDEGSKWYRKIDIALGGMEIAFSQS